MRYNIQRIASLPTPFIVLYIAMIAGTLDIAAAMLVNMIPPGVVFRFIASGYFGRAEAFTGGGGMIVAGIVFHYFIALCWTVLYYAAFPLIRRWRAHAVVKGFIYGIIIWMVMNLLVLPLSNIPQREATVVQALIGIVILILMVGIPIAWLTAQHYRRREG